ncbi:unnamed protein product [Lactuca saligna]|uniref:Uncharacterized protein n=1 Tax=Lactuca saligna TaxID=75948 RepID=A0AA35VKX4_LACSI|nr:unnamed protein product [Lactuca saligna]
MELPIYKPSSITTTITSLFVQDIPISNPTLVMLGTEFRRLMVIGKYMTIPAGDDNFSAQNQKTGGFQKTVGEFWKREDIIQIPKLHRFQVPIGSQGNRFIYAYRTPEPLSSETAVKIYREIAIIAKNSLLYLGQPLMTEVMQLDGGEDEVTKGVGGIVDVKVWCK